MKVSHNTHRINALHVFGGLAEIVCFGLLYYLFWESNFSEIHTFHYGWGKYALVGVYMVLMFWALRFSDGLRFGQLKFTEILVSQTVSIIGVNIISFFQLSLIANAFIPVLPGVLFSLVLIFLALVFSYIFTAIYHSVIVPSDFLLIYGSDNALDFKFKADGRGKEFKVSKIIRSDVEFGLLCEEILKHEAVVMNDVNSERRNDILKFCFVNNITAYVVPKISDILIKGASNINLFDTPLYDVKINGLSVHQAFVKRAFDLFVSIMAIILLSPVFIIVPVLIKLEDGGPVFYRQKRVTKNGKVFEILKFRSMIVNAEEAGVSVPATENDPRITRTGRFIRACRIDELPQLFNILGGSMSIVGPRPERVEHVEKYKSEIPEFVFREKVKGGLTGYAQIFGKYNTSPYDKIRLDLIYIENYSFLFDLKLIILTIRILFQKESTEGFDKAEELEKKKQELLKSQR